MNHGIRGVEAEEDACFVRSVCARWNVELDEIVLVPPRDHADEDMGTGRALCVSGTVCEKHHARVATAHTRSDQAETVLLNLARGSGKGSSGHPAGSRFLLDRCWKYPRRKFWTIWERKELPYRTDSTNLDCNYTRNAIRWEVLPALERARPDCPGIGALCGNMEQLSNIFLDRRESFVRSPAFRAEYDAEIMRAAPRSCAGQPSQN